MLTRFPEEPSADPFGPPAGCAADWTIPQRWDEYSRDEHNLWDALFARQSNLLENLVVPDFVRGIDLLRLSRPGIPEFCELNERLTKRTGWTVVAVPGLVPDDVFFTHLSQRRFPAGNFIRPADQLDYLEEPDVFHDLFGHVPMLANPALADLTQRIGALGLDALRRGEGDRIARLYWHTIEFGLAAEGGTPKIYGAGIASSFEESRHAVLSDVPRREDFDLRQVLSSPYESDKLQSRYFVVESVEALVHLIDRTDFAALYDELRAA